MFLRELYGRDFLRCYAFPDSCMVAISRVGTLVDKPQLPAELLRAYLSFLLISPSCLLSRSGLTFFLQISPSCLSSR